MKIMEAKMAKYGINLLLWSGSFNNDALPLIKKVADFGFDGVEIPIFDPAQVDIKATNNALKSAGLECTTCAILGDDRDIISDDPAIRNSAKKYMKESIDISDALNARVFCGPLYSAVGKLVGRGRTDEEWKLAVDGLSEIAEYAGKKNVVLAMEPLNRFETYFINIAEDMVKLVKEINHPNMKVHLDTFHMNIEEKSLYKAIKNTGEYLAHVHTCENDRGTPGSGNVDWDGVFKALHEINYNGWLVIESFVPAIEAIAKAAAIWRELEPGGADEIAKNGLAFNKSRM
jgi:D-psicose/D-tagatose/L-ribulose 3-epimerase